MSTLIFLICIIFIVFSLLVDKRIYSPIVLFNFWWGITIFISGFGFFGIYVPSVNTYLIMLVAIISFNFSFIFILNRKESKKSFVPRKVNNEYYNIKTVFNCIIGMQLLVIAELIRRSINVLKLLASGMDYERIRYEYFYSDTIMSGYEHLIGNYLVTPIIYFSIILISLFFFEKQYNKLLMFTTIVCVGLFVFSSGERGIVLSFGLFMILAYFIQGRKIKINILKKAMLLILLAIFVYFLVYITIVRGTLADFHNVLCTVTLYFSAPYIFYEQLSSYALQDNVLLFGGAFFGGILDTFILGLRYIGLDISTMSSYISRHNQMSLAVGNNLSYNAFPTMVYTFLYDFNYVGVILGPLLFGIIVTISYKKMIMTNRLAYKGIYFMIALMIYESVMKWVGTSEYPWIVIAMFLIFDHFTKKRIRFIL